MFEGFRSWGKPDSDQIEVFKFRLCHRIFVEAANEDYLAARFFWRVRAGNQFAWSASQALEKYIKGARLICGLSAKFRHGYHTKLEELIAVASGTIPDTLNRPPALSLADGFHDEFPESSIDAAKRFEENGHTQQRYRQKGLLIRPYDLCKLDQLCLSLLSSCFPPAFGELVVGETLEQTRKSLFKAGFGNAEVGSLRSPGTIGDLLFDMNYALQDSPNEGNFVYWINYRDTAFRLDVQPFNVNYLKALEWLVGNTVIKEAEIASALEG